MLKMYQTKCIATKKIYQNLFIFNRSYL